MRGGNMIPGRIDTNRYKQVTLQSDYDRDGKLIIAYDDQGDIYVETHGEVRFANLSTSLVGKTTKEFLKDLVNHSLSDIPIGTCVEHQGKVYVCKHALSDDQKEDPDEECEGCAFNALRRKGDDVCSKFYCCDCERADNTYVRFVEKGGQDE